MKITLVALCLVIISTVSIAQKKLTFLLSDLKSKSDINPTAQKAVTYILSTPADTTDSMRLDASGYLMTWMEKTPDYSFSIDESIAKIIEDNKNEAYVLFAGMVDCALNQKGQTDQEIKLCGVKKLIEYSKNPSYKLTPGAELRNIIEVDKRGSLKQYLSE